MKQSDIYIAWQIDLIIMYRHDARPAQSRYATASEAVPGILAYMIDMKLL